MAELMNGHLFRVLLLGALLYAGLQLTLPIPSLITVENGLLLSISGGVAIAYMPIAWVALRTSRPVRGHYLGLGIFISWVAQFGIRVLSICIANLGYLDVLNSHWRTLFVAPMILGGVLHLLAPNAEDVDLGRQRWIFPGVVVGVGILVVFLLSSLPGTSS
jgi:hypothetical protein